MTLLFSLKISLNNLRANKKRSFLTMLGIIIGVGAVILIMAVGAGAQSLIINELNSAGSNLFGVTPGASNEDGPPASVFGITITTLKNRDIEDVAKLPKVEAVIGYVRGVETVTYFNQKVDTTFVGVNTELLTVESTAVGDGRFFDKEEEKGLARVAVLGWQVKEDLFGNTNAVGENFRIGKHDFKVIGVMEERGTVAFENKDDLIYIPISTAQKVMLGINHIALMRGKAKAGVDLEEIKEEVAQTLRDNHNIEKAAEDDFSVRSMDQALDAVTGITDALKFFLAGIAAISLLVGGVGIMNIMLVIIQERTREIGLRKAVGATRGHILKQFLVESGTITICGGIIGMLGGISLAFLVAKVARGLGYQWDFVVSIFSILLGLTVSGAIGIIFGVYPAWKAAKLEPVEALRKE